MTAFGDEAARRQEERAGGFRGFFNAIGPLGGAKDFHEGDRVVDASIANARRNAESQEATMANYGGGATGGQSIYSTTGHGLLGAPFDINLRDPGGYTDPRAGANRQALDARAAAIGGMPNQSMQFTSAAGVDPNQAFRSQQIALGNALMAQANGQGPSVAGSQLQQSTDMNLQAAMAQAASARGGSLGAAQYQLGNARANIQQQAAQQLAQTRIQEQMAARAQLGQVLEQGRGGDIATAGMAQQNSQFNAGQANSVGATNLNANIQQEQYRQTTLNQLLAMGMTYDQAAAQADLQARQFGADLFNRSQLGVQGLNSQAAGQTLQLVGGGISAGGQIFSSAANGLAK